MGVGESGIKGKSGNRVVERGMPSKPERLSEITHTLQSDSQMLACVCVCEPDHQAGQHIHIRAECVSLHYTGETWENPSNIPAFLQAPPLPGRDGAGMEILKRAEERWRWDLSVAEEALLLAPPPGVWSHAGKQTQEASCRAQLDVHRWFQAPSQMVPGSFPRPHRPIQTRCSLTPSCSAAVAAAAATVAAACCVVVAFGAV